MANATTTYEFEWDPLKARSNRRKHGVSFEEAATVFLDPRALSVYDEEHSSREDRWITLGLSSAGRLLTLCHTFREIQRRACGVRIISSRKATTRETSQYAR